MKRINISVSATSSPASCLLLRDTLRWFGPVQWRDGEAVRLEVAGRDLNEGQGGEEWM